ncbi:MAG: archaeosortase/exosortase family protein [Verrucomicrobiota bacterium]
MLALHGLMSAYMFRQLSGNVFNAPIVLMLILMAGYALSAAIARAEVLGSAMSIGGILVFVYGIYPGQNDYFKDIGMVQTIFGVATLLAGWEVMKVAWFPIAFMLVAVPWPDLWYSELAGPLQQLAASASVGTLCICGVEATRLDTKITMIGAGNQPRTLNVAEACAGLRSLMTFVMVAGTVAFLSSRLMWEKIAITLMAIPIAIFCNMLRVAGQGLLDRYVSVELSEGFAHQFVGLFMLIPGFFMILGVGWVIDKMFVREEDIEKHKAEIAGARATDRKVIQVPRRKEAPAPDAEKGDVSGEVAAPSIEEVPSIEKAAALTAEVVPTVGERVEEAQVARPAETELTASSEVVVEPPSQTLAPSPAVVPVPVHEAPVVAKPTTPAQPKAPTVTKPAAAKPVASPARPVTKATVPSATSADPRAATTPGAPARGLPSLPHRVPWPLRRGQPRSPRPGPPRRPWPNLRRRGHHRFPQRPPSPRPPHRCREARSSPRRVLLHRVRQWSRRA